MTGTRNVQAGWSSRWQAGTVARRELRTPLRTVEIRPFRGIRYDPALAGDMARNVCPPFDVITPSLQKELYERSPHNLVRLELARRGLGSDPHAPAAETQRQWVAAGVFQRDAEPSVYVTEETFQFAGQSMVRRGFIGSS